MADSGSRGHPNPKETMHDYTLWAWLGGRWEGGWHAVYTHHNWDAILNCVRHHRRELPDVALRRSRNA